MKELFLAIVISFSIAGPVRAQQWTTNANDIYSANSGNVGIGTGTLSAKFNIFQNLQLGTAAQNNTLLSSTTGSAFNNVVRNNVWLVRNTAGNTWSTARLHDGISIDNIFINPQVDTKTWWERDPNYNIQAWAMGQILI